MTVPGGTASGLRQRAGLQVLGWPALDSGMADVIVTTRHGGSSRGPYRSLNLGLHVGDDPDDVLANRRRAAAAAGVSLTDMVFCNQSHDRNIRIVTAADRGRGALSQADAIPATDALVTAEPGIALVVMVADCVPIVLYDPSAQVIACVHAGWRGTVARVAEAALDAMASLGSHPRDVIAGIGPAISPMRYQVDRDVVEAAEQSLGHHLADAAIQPDGTGRWLFDLWKANQAMLREAGLRDGNVHVARVPTGTAGRGLFFSDRETRPCGRFAAIARLRPGQRLE
jgi:polyphenol oxidase